MNSDLAIHPRSISKGEAKKIILLAQGLNKTNPFGTGPSSVSKAVEHLGYVQIDTISVVERAHHHVLHTRIPNYKKEWLDSVQIKTRNVFEYWAHAAAYLPMTDYRFSLPVMQIFKSKKDRWPKSQRGEMKKILDRIRLDGPVMSRDFDSDHKGGTWWDWKPAKWALQRLYLEGELMVSHRQGFQRVYDLPERIIPTEVDTSTPDTKTYYRHLIMSTLKAQGIAARNELIHLRHIDHKKFDQVLQELIEDNIIEPVRVGTWPKTMYTLPDMLNQRIRISDRITLLSPFDNSVIWRNRLSDVFDFDYTLECYVPAHKRVYGYFCLPILLKDNFVGRADLKAERKSGALQVKKVIWTTPEAREEAQVKWPQFLERFAAFNQCTTVVYNPNKDKFAAPL